MRAFSNVFVV